MVTVKNVKDYYVKLLALTVTEDSYFIFFLCLDLTHKIMII